MNKEITQEYVKELFEYKNGNLYWKVNKKSNKVKNKKAGGLHKVTGYYYIRIDSKSYRSHRLIYLYHYGYLPKYIDHIDRNKQNNNIENLREVTQSQNLMNSKSYKNSSSIYKGVTWDKSVNKWHVQIQINNKSKYLGLFINELDAALAYNKAAKDAFGKYANLNIIGND